MYVKRNSNREEGLTLTRNLSAPAWRVLSYLYHPDQQGRRTGVSLRTVMSSQQTERDAALSVVERGLVEPRHLGQECTLSDFKKLGPESIRLRITRAGRYVASNDPQHRVMCALRAQPDGLTVHNLMYLQRASGDRRPSFDLSPTINFSELAGMRERNLFEAYLIKGEHTDLPAEWITGDAARRYNNAATNHIVEVFKLADVHKIPGTVYVKPTRHGLSHVAYV